MGEELLACGGHKIGETIGGPGVAISQRGEGPGAASPRSVS